MCWSWYARRDDSDLGNSPSYVRAPKFARVLPGGDGPIIVRLKSSDQRIACKKLEGGLAGEKEVSAAADGNERLGPAKASIDRCALNREPSAPFPDVRHANQRIKFVGEAAEERRIHPSLLYEFELAFDTGVDRHKMRAALLSVVRLFSVVPRLPAGPVGAEGALAIDAAATQEAVTLASAYRLLLVIFIQRIARIAAANVCADRAAKTVTVFVDIAEVIYRPQIAAPVIRRLVGRKREGSAVVPAADDLGRNKPAEIDLVAEPGRLAVAEYARPLLDQVGEGEHVLLQLAVHQEAAIAAEIQARE